MKRWILLPLALIVVGGCASKKEIAHEQQRRDTFHAVMSEQLCLKLDDVIVLPRDSVKPVVIARRAEVTRRADAQVVRKVEEVKTELNIEKTEAPRAGASPFKLILMVVILLLFGRLLYKGRCGD